MRKDLFRRKAESPSESAWSLGSLDRDLAVAGKAFFQTSVELTERIVAARSDGSSRRSRLRMGILGTIFLAER